MQLLNFFKNLAIILLFIILSFSLGIFKTRKIISSQGLDEIDFLINENKIKKGSIPTVLYIWATWCTVCKANSYIIEYNYLIAAAFNINFISLE
jgi:thiol-disulfide isomerase/thioredoxin